MHRSEAGEEVRNGHMTLKVSRPERPKSHPREFREEILNSTLKKQVDFFKMKNRSPKKSFLVRRNLSTSLRFRHSWYSQLGSRPLCISKLTNRPAFSRTSCCKIQLNSQHTRRTANTPSRTALWQPTGQFRCAFHSNGELSMQKSQESFLRNSPS